MNPPLLLVTELYKQFKKFSFGPFDLQVEPGTAIALIGANGAGKSTFFRLLMRLLQPDAGEVHMFGSNLARDDAEIKQKVGYVANGLFQPFSHLSIEALASLRRYWYPNWDEERFLELVRRYDIDRKQIYGNSSTGTQKKVDFIFALTHRPKLLLLDEPTSGVDMISQTWMKEDMSRHLESGQNSMIIATHQQEEIQQMCDRICLLHDGKLMDTIAKENVQHFWARIWVSALSEPVKAHPAVLDVSEVPCQLVTRNRPEIERLLDEMGIAVTHTQHLELHEVFAYVLKEERVQERSNV